MPTEASTWPSGLYSCRFGQALHMLLSCVSESSSLVSSFPKPLHAQRRALNHSRACSTIHVDLKCKSSRTLGAESPNRKLRQVNFMPVVTSANSALQLHGMLPRVQTERTDPGEQCIASPRLETCRNAKANDCRACPSYLVQREMTGTDQIPQKPCCKLLTRAKTEGAAVLSHVDRPNALSFLLASHCETTLFLCGSLRLDFASSHRDLILDRLGKAPKVLAPHFLHKARPVRTQSLEACLLCYTLRIRRVLA